MQWGWILSNRYDLTYLLGSCPTVLFASILHGPSWDQCSFRGSSFLSRSLWSIFYVVCPVVFGLLVWCFQANFTHLPSGYRRILISWSILGPLYSPWNASCVLILYLCAMLSNNGPHIFSKNLRSMNWNLGSVLNFNNSNFISLLYQLFSSLINPCFWLFISFSQAFLRCFKDGIS